MNNPTNTSTCSQCGAPVKGAFCAGCGTPVATAGCTACGTTLSPGARFCHLCGAPQGRPAKMPVSPLPWAVAGGALVVLVLVLVVRPPSSPANPTPATSPGMAGGAVAPDLSSMTPREQADRLFERVMTAAEQGDSAEVAQFASKTVDAYALLDSLDADARYHVALIQETQGDVTAALAQADSMESAVPGHLLASIVRQRAAQRSGDEAGALRAYRRFLEYYEREGAVDRPEYVAHRRTIDGFLVDARRATGT